MLSQFRPISESVSYYRLSSILLIYLPDYEVITERYLLKYLFPFRNTKYCEKCRMHSTSQ